MSQSSLPLSWIKKHRFGFLAQMWQQKEPLVLVKGGFWTLRSLSGWYTDVDVVSEAQGQGYLAGLLTYPEGCLDARILTSRGEAYASDLIRKIPPTTRARPRRKNIVAGHSNPPDASESIEPIRAPDLSPKALKILRQVEADVLADPNCFTLRACCESIPEFKTKASPDKYPRSGVIACLAGVACLSIAKEKGAATAGFVNKPHSELAAFAGSELGLTAAQGRRLFAHWTYDFLTLYRHSTSAFERALIVGKRIEWFIATGE